MRGEGRDHGGLGPGREGDETPTLFGPVVLGVALIRKRSGASREQQNMRGRGKREREREREKERERERPSFEYINIYLCTEVVTTRLRAGLARAGDLMLHAHTHTHTHTQTTQARWSLCWEHVASR